MSDRVPCADCGVPVPAAALTVVAEKSVCPRCFALAAPATLSRERGSDRGPAGSWPEAAPAVATLPSPVGGPVPEVAIERAPFWWLRVPVLAWLAWDLLRLWSDPSRGTLWRGIDLAIHEIGHVLWSPLGEFAGMAGGTVTQLLVPLAAGLVLYRQRDRFGLAVAWSWVGINALEVSVYAGDALARRLPLVSPVTATPIHDWAYLLGELGLLRHTDAIADAWLWAGRLILATGVAYGVRVLWRMAAPPAPAEAAAAPERAGP